MTTPAAVVAGQAAKDKGNAAFKAGDFAGAVGHYSAAMLADARNAAFPLNRAAAYLKLGKNEDAERDCSTVLTLDAKNVKALFRRGQARTALQKLADAHADFQHALRLEPANAEVQRELKRVDEALQAQKSKKPPRTKPAEVPAIPAKPSTPPTTKSPAPKRRRVPIEVVEPGPPPPPPAPISESSSPSELLTPVSSRTLPATPAPAPAPVPTPTPATFQAAKEARASRPMGGIFRPDGRHTLFGAHEKENAKPRAEAALPAASPMTAVPAAARPSMTLFAFTRRWEGVQSAEERWALLNEVPPVALPALFQASLDADMLSAMLAAFRDVLKGSIAQPVQVRAYVLSLARVPRFSTVVLFMGRAERAVIKEVWELVGSGSGEERERRAWGVS